MRLQQQTVFITEADSASGAALLRRLADEGASFIVNSPSGGGAIEAEIEHCRKTGSGILVVNLDLCASAEVSGMLEEAERQIGPVDVLIHNANRIEPASVEASGEDAFFRMMNYHAKSALICTQAVGRQMAARRSGKIIYIGSIHAEKPTGVSFLYSISRSSIKMLSKEAALELGRYGINVNTIEAGSLEGAVEPFRSTRSSLYDDAKYKIPSTEMGTYDDLAETVLYLAAGASRYVNGADLRLDGGFLLHYMDHKMNKPR
ncbi:SDR family NAD(P)-dependent oxidoreductase [Paenibacillus sp. TAB 01]|uniref:SDR family NAD(P)-dependent oxidoreductase n=1 Tax=Paenibacillus sp. TAB 01 TaxID=3368988 RepID=UPI00374FEF21